jgi:hypothetical protein
MRLDAHRRLRALAEAQGAEYGKLVQKLLALAFLEVGATVTDRAVQGVDLEVVLGDGRRVALEVKTTVGGEVTLAGKDLAGLRSREREGYEPFVAALGPGLLDEWIFARARLADWQGGVRLSLLALRPHRDRALEETVSAAFAEAVARHAPRAMTGGQAALNEAIRAHVGSAVP